MAITYDDTLPDNLSTVRFNIGDTVEDEGPRPANRNYSDNEINALLTKNNNDTLICTAVLFDTLATEWSKFAISFTMGPRKEELFRIAGRFEGLSREWALKAGTTYTTFNGGVRRRSENSQSVT